jgi:hypothetical protein
VTRRTLTVLLALAALPASAGVAGAARPVHGGHYEGHLRTGNPSPPVVTFDVSRGGTQVRNLRVTYPPLLCALGGMTPPQQKAAPAPISRSGAFAQTVSFATPAGKVFATIRITGRFRSHRRETGRARVRWPESTNPRCGGRLRYSARAR